MATVKTLPVNVYYNDHFRRCANDGVTETCETLYLVIPEGWYSLEESDPRLLRIVEHRGKYMHAEPINPGDTSGCVGPMFGGNFVYTSDSRFPNKYPIPVHDRYETYEQYKLLCD